MEFKATILPPSNVEEDGTFSGHGSVFDVVHQSSNFNFDLDVVHKGAFKKSLVETKKAGRSLKMLYRHRDPLGIYDEVEEDDIGLFVKGKPNDTMLGRDAIVDMRSGVLDGLSIGFDPEKWDVEEVDNMTLRHLREIKLGEVSPVIWGANPQALIEEVKGFDMNSITDIRGFERFLREAGWSKAAAKVVAAHGFPGLSELHHRDDGDQDVKDMTALLQGLRGSLQL